MRGSSGGEREAKSPWPEEENIMNLLPRPPVLIRKEKRHVSRHHDRVVEEGRGRDSHATLGKAAPADQPSPAHYLKKGHRNQYTHALASSNHARAAEERPHMCPKRPPLPTPVSYPPPERDRCGVNWVADNVAGASAAGTRGSRSHRGQRLVVDDLTGHRQDLHTAGLYPRYVFKKNFGRVPSYLSRRQNNLTTKKEEEEEEEEREEGRKERRKRGRGKEVKRKEEEEEEEEYTMLPEEEKEELLKGLHANLREAQRRLQSLPVVCETLASRARRDQLEQRVTDLQRYIFLLQNHVLALTT